MTRPKTAGERTASAWWPCQALHAELGMEGRGLQAGESVETRLVFQEVGPKEDACLPRHPVLKKLTQDTALYTEPVSVIFSLETNFLAISTKLVALFYRFPFPLTCVYTVPVSITQHTSSLAPGLCWLVGRSMCT